MNSETHTYNLSNRSKMQKSIIKLSITENDEKKHMKM